MVQIPALTFDLIRKMAEEVEAGLVVSLHEKR
jgi:hypothetical protein